MRVWWFWAALTALLVAGCSNPPGVETAGGTVSSWCDAHGNRIYRDSNRGNIFVLARDCLPPTAGVDIQDARCGHEGRVWPGRTVILPARPSTQ